MDVNRIWNGITAPTFVFEGIICLLEMLRADWIEPKLELKDDAELWQPRDAELWQPRDAELLPRTSGKWNLFKKWVESV